MPSANTEPFTGPGTIPVAASLPAPTVGMMPPNSSIATTFAPATPTPTGLEYQSQPTVTNSLRPDFSQSSVITPITLNRGQILDEDENEQLSDVNEDEDNASSSHINADGTPGLLIETQPPIEVRTRTPSEKRYAGSNVLIVRHVVG